MIEAIKIIAVDFSQRDNDKCKRRGPWHIAIPKPNGMEIDVELAFYLKR